MKFRSHLYRMNPQATYNQRRFPKVSTLLTVILLLSLAALYWIGKYSTH